MFNEVVKVDLNNSNSTAEKITIPVGVGGENKLILKDASYGMSGFYHNKKVFLKNDIYEPYSDELLGWEVIPLKGDIAITP